MGFLAIDIGNTRLKWALYASGQPGANLLAQGACFLETIDDLAEGAWHAVPEPQGMLGCVVAGDAVRRRVEAQIEQRWPELAARWVVPSGQCGQLSNGYDVPSRLGADRWAALAGAWWRQHSDATHRPALVVMVGTAVTVDALSQQGRFLGGLILPGFGLMLKALEMGTAGLKVPTGELVSFPTNTSDALMSGGSQAIAGAIERQLRLLTAQAGQAPLLFVTGGAASKLAADSKLPFQVVDTLIFDGLLWLAHNQR